MGYSSNLNAPMDVNNKQKPIKSSVLYPEEALYLLENVINRHG